ncbi:MAG TPA: 8-amino-7-oxononanoate synthase [Vicinamibacterales bacterium]|nr:8-amino-7-oxononanoate synthase [Vicinamibacterales bacterium]
MSSANPLEARIRRRLAEWEAAGLLRTLRPPSGVDFSSNDYLNLSTHPRILDRLARAVAHHGCGSTGSRLLRGDRAVFGAVERRFARFKSAERSLYFSSGYLANIAVLTSLTERGDIVFSDERNHASLIDGIRLSRAARVVFPHNDARRLAELLSDAPSGGHRFVVVESVYSMDGDVAPLADYANLCRSAGATLIVDEAHAVGIYGATGSGLIEDSELQADTLLSINTAGKALGVSGAFAAGPAWAIDYLVQRARPFVFSTAPPPALAEALDASLDVVENEPERRERLKSRVRRVREQLAASGIDAAQAGSQIVPIVLGDNDRAVSVAEALQREGFDVRAIRPPSVPQGTARLRVSVNAGLTDDSIDRFARSVAMALKEVGLCSAGFS